MYITKVRIQQIRKFTDVSLQFDAPVGWHVLLGDNGSGKSTLLQAISIGLLQSEIHSLQLRLAQWLQPNKQYAQVTLNICPDPTSDFVKSDFISTNGDLVISIGLGAQVPLHLISLASYSPVNLVDGSSVAGEKNVHWRYFTEQGWFSAAFGPFRRFVENESTKNYISTRLQAHHSLFKEDAPLQDALLWLIQLQFKSLEKDKNATFLLQKLILFINQSELLPQGVRLTKISSEGVFFKDAINKALEINQLSDGFRAVLSLVFELLRHLVGVFGAKRVFQNMTNDNLMIDLSGVVLIDEVDVHLHPSWQTRIGDWFLKCFPKMQFIVTTHSPLICRACERGSIWRLPNQPNEKLVEIKGIDKQKLIYGNVLDAYGTEVFGQAVVRSAKSDEKLSRLGRLDMLSAFGKITPEQETERIELQKIFSTDGIFDK